MPVDVVVPFTSVDETLVCDHSNEKLLSSPFMLYCLLCCTMCFQLLRLWMKTWCVTIQMKTIEQYFHVVLFITLYKVVLTFTSVYETLVCDHSNESYWAVLSCDTVCAAQGGSTFLVWMKPKLLSSTVILPFINLPCKNRALKLVSLDNWRVAILVIPLYLLANIKSSVNLRNKL